MEVIEFNYRKPEMTQEMRIAIRLMNIARQAEEDADKLKAFLKRRSEQRRIASMFDRLK